jgi:hypothetical protein
MSIFFAKLVAVFIGASCLVSVASSGGGATTAAVVVNDETEPAPPPPSPLSPPGEDPSRRGPVRRP